MRKNIDLQNILPHREPMLMTDEVLEINHDSVTTKFLVKPDNIFCENGKFNEAGLIENCAQTCSTITGQNHFLDDESPEVIGFISNIKKVKIHALPGCGAEIVCKARLLSEFENICHIACESFAGEQLLLEAEMVMFLQKISG